MAEVDGQIVGFTAYQMTPHKHAYGTAHEVSPAYRGRRLGDRLHGERLIHARAAGATHFVGATTVPAMVAILEAWGGLKVPVQDAEGKDCYVTRLDV